MKTRSRKTRESAEPRGRGERLQKVLAAAGIASRRACEELIRSGRVRVNGVLVRELGTRADARRHRITVDGKRIRRARQARYYLLYKPRGVVSTTRDPHAKRTVLDLVPSHERLFPVGRLDAASEGLILLTNDGAAAQLLLHPSHGVVRIYRVSVQGRMLAASLSRLTRGVPLEGQVRAARSVQILERDDTHTVLEMTLTEGRRRQIRDMMRAVGHPVRRLVRVAFGPLRLRGLAPGEWRPLNPRERAALERLVEQGPSERPASEKATGERADG